MDHIWCPSPRLMDFQEGSQVRDQSIVIFPFHPNCWSTWGPHQALQIPQLSNSSASLESVKHRGWAAPGTHPTTEGIACPPLLWRERVSSTRDSQSLLRAMQPLCCLGKSKFMCVETRCLHKDAALAQGLCNGRSLSDTETSLLWWSAWVQGEMQILRCP